MGQQAVQFRAHQQLVRGVSSARGRILEIGGPDNLTFNQLATAIQQAAGRASSPRHVPPSVLRLIARSAGFLRPELGRQARAALVMDQANFTFDPTAIRRAYPGIPRTPLSMCLRHPAADAARAGAHPTT